MRFARRSNSSVPFLPSRLYFANQWRVFLSSKVNPRLFSYCINARSSQENATLRGLATSLSVYSHVRKWYTLMISFMVSNIVDTSEKPSMRQAIVVFTILLAVIQAQEKPVVYTGVCSCRCCKGNRCSPVKWTPFSVVNCSSCTRETCRTVYSNVCPSKEIRGRTRASCVSNSAATASLGTFVAIVSLVTIKLGRDYGF